MTPTGLDASGAVLASQSGETGYMLTDISANRLVLGRPPAAPTQNPSQYMFDSVINPTGQPGTFYVRITTFSSNDGSGPPTDFGALANATTDGIGITSEVPPILKFCVGLELELDCTGEGDNIVDLGTLNSAVAASGTSQMIAATNADFGLGIAVYGTTLTSGTNVIPPLTTAAPSAPGNTQFGLNVRRNTEPAIGREPDGIGVANPTTAYGTPNRYTFNSGDIVATSPDVTDTRRFTVSYVANVSPTQPPGVYAATLTYVCTASF